jgi:hypothetical protein
MVAHKPKPKRALRSTFVTMVKTADTRPGYYLAAADAGLTTFRSLLLETTVGAVLMVVVDIRGEQPFQRGSLTAIT